MDRFVRGQGANTRARNAISGVQARIDAVAEEYRTAFGALESLAPISLKNRWKEELTTLMPQDIRDLSEGKSGESGGRRTISWIWWMAGMRPSAESDDDSLLDREFQI
jgi:hypothetical protein